MRQGIHRAAVHLQVEQAVAVEVDAEVLAGTQCHAAHLRLDHPVVADLGAEQGDAAAFTGGERTGVAHGGAGVAGEAVVAVEEVFVGDVPRGGHQATDVDLGGLAEHHPVGVDQEDLAVGVDAALDITAIGTDHTVEGDGVFAGLVEADALVSADTEVVPVGDQFVGVLVDDHVLAIGGGLQSCFARDDRCPAGQGEGWGLAEQPQQRGAGGDHDLAASRFPSPARHFAGDIPAAQGLIPDQCIAFVHVRSSMSENSADPQQNG
ncbi:hypothetical protein D9M69_391240 [compost metagenome]